MQKNQSALEIIVGNYRYSSWSMRGWLAVAHSGLAHSTRRIPLFTEEGTETLREISPSGKVPCLIDHSHAPPVVVWDSAAIIEYLARLAPERYWWPGRPAAFAFARSMAAEMHSGFQALRQACPMNLGVTHRDLQFHDDVKADIARVEELWRDARSRFGVSARREGPFLFGAWSAADIMYAPVVSRFLTYGVRLGPVGRSYMAAVNSYAKVDHWYRAAQLEKEHIARYDAAVLDGFVGHTL